MSSPPRSDNPRPAPAGAARPPGPPEPSCRSLPTSRRGARWPAAPESPGVRTRRAARQGRTTRLPPRAAMSAIPRSSARMPADPTSRCAADRGPSRTRDGVSRRSSRPMRPRSPAAGRDCAEADDVARTIASAITAHIIGRARARPVPADRRSRLSGSFPADRQIRSDESSVRRTFARAAERRAGHRRSPTDAPRRR